MSYPEYRIEPPDILLIETVQNIRPQGDKIRAGDELLVRVANTFPIDPDDDPIANEFKIINNIYPVQTDGTIDLGPEYGMIAVGGLSISEAKAAITKHLAESAGLISPRLWVTMPNVDGKQLVAGEHLVRPDGTVSLGVYGNVYLQGMTLDEAKFIVEEHLKQNIHEPEVTVDVLVYNSMVYYVITDGGGFGEQVARLPCTGNETVLDAIANIQGLSQISSKKIWLSRPAPAEIGISQTLPVDWRAITVDGIPATNYQIFPGDRIYIVADHMIAFDNWVGKVTAPFERMFGFTLLGNGMVRSLQRGANANTGGGGFGGF